MAMTYPQQRDGRDPAPAGFAVQHFAPVPSSQRWPVHASHTTDVVVLLDWENLTLGVQHEFQTTPNIPAYGMNDSYNYQVLWKYPQCCYHCAAERCVCSTRKGPALEDPEEKEAQEEENQGALNLARDKTKGWRTTEKPPLDALVEMFIGVYENVDFVTPLEYIIAHFQEEVGEVAECINNIEDGRGVPDWKDKLALELADIFTWTTALLWKFDYMLGAAEKYVKLQDVQRRERAGDITREVADRERSEIRKRRQTAGLKLSQALWDRYGSNSGMRLRCPRCGHEECNGEDPPLGKS